VRGGAAARRGRSRGRSGASGQGSYRLPAGRTVGSRRRFGLSTKGEFMAGETSNTPDLGVHRNRSSRRIASVPVDGGGARPRPERRG
jgi:hypothetical protein